ncbi:MAG: efflux RND transporter periplasmic adaptor subunit [Pyramidobacter sp.]|jgi:HlyD family secretion protein
MKNTALKKLVLLAALAAALGSGAFFYYGGRAASSTVSYRTAPVVRGSLRSVIHATGSLSAQETVDVGTQISGTINEIAVDYNDKVAQGQLIAVMDSRMQQAEVDIAQANVAAAKAELARARAALLRATRDLRRTRELIKKDLIARSDLDAAVEAKAAADANVRSAEAAVAQRLAALRKAEVNLGYTKIYSPVDGVIVNKNVEKGQTVAASYQTPSLVEIARDLKLMQLKVNVDEADVGSVKVDQKAEFTVDAYPDRTFEGRVTQVRISPSSSDNVVSYTVVVGVSNDDERLMPGMTANVNLVVDEKHDVLLVPNSALRFRPVEAAGQIARGSWRKPVIVSAEAPGVYVLQGGVPVKTEVEKGITDGQNTEILSGLREGTVVLVGFKLKPEKK